MRSIVKNILITTLLAALAFSGTAALAQEQATADVTEAFAGKYMPITKALRKVCVKFEVAMKSSSPNSRKREAL